ncbi:Protein-tyrosine-phosphatase [Caldicellulosiruptor owensensis OL]|uniref:protein-tyrosine-phosphatase n=1 Tax=Caldicellulosiruptor owensensis (strain ATCC 700167 / DSM 13100 / OL) TaxID=632518 RepID=E4Q5T4_CALOW|nr:CpsB/CapC family capsule biosynthesis tyrosine phosphatase [Caldicellulosiruptor owensensis]ADQ05493.1 Protein-tyrosine-phosphatase [Caldicellulosiruptor owensensis OL]
MIDIHCHLMVGVDDGAETLEEAKNMIKLAREEGITGIIVTPHYSAKLKFFYETKFKQLQEMSIEEGVMLYRGCEYKLKDALTQKDDLITLADSDYVLVEITSGILAEYVLNQIYELKLCGYEIIIAHPERSFEKKDIDKLVRLSEMGVYFQLTAGSFAGVFGRRVQKFAAELLEIGLCHFIASDAHDSKVRKFYFNEVKRYFKSNYKEKEPLDVLLTRNGESVLKNSGEIVTFSVSKKNIFERMFS